MNLRYDRDHQMACLVAAVKSDPAKAETVLRVGTRWTTGLRSEAVMEREGGAHTVVMDEPSAFGGTDTGPSMGEVLLGAYGCCLITGFVVKAEKRGILLKRVEIDVEADIDLRGFLGLADDVPTGYSEVRATVRLDAPGTARADLEALKEAVQRTSPVGHVIATPVRLKTELV